MRTLCSRSPSASTSDTAAQPASRYPPRIGAITPSSETTTARASSGTSTVASRTVVSKSSRCASQRADSALGSRSRELFDGDMFPNVANTSSASRGVRCDTSIAL